ncbi:hypothetical protein C8R47DRAFT_161776 [Mycena vitilis]|nr:hypothetical protein C8R47DRAFT_161776 [Mycena vitilis]
MSADSHITEFDAPPSAIPSERNKNRHYSIDLSLELEHQLEMESPLPTPAHNKEQQEEQQKTHQARPSFQLPDIDPHVLAHIISQLRHQLADMTKERDDILVLLSAANTKEAELQDALQHITDKAMGLDEALSEARRKTRDDEEAIAMLRTKVEESRRGLMRLQAESRRSTPMALDTGRANAPSAFALGPPSSNKRASASFTPLTGTFAANSFGGRPNGHRRISSVSDSNVSITVPDVNAAAQPPVPNRRLSSIFGRSSPPREPPLQLHASGSGSSSPDEVEKLRKELRTVKAALEETRHELTEANEAREASETCAGALREYIAESNMGSAELKLPPLPAATTGEETDPNAKKGWGFTKLWKVDTSVKGAPGPASDVTASPVNTSTASNTPPAPLARKLTGFFGSRASISSVASSLAPLQTTGAPHASRQRDSVYSVSDASSLAEPISPTSQVGGGAEVRVRDVNGSPEISPDAMQVKEARPLPVDDAMSLRSVGE